MLVMMHRRDAEEAFRAVEERLQDGERPTEAEVSELKQSVQGLKFVTSTYVEPWADGLSE